MFAFCSGSFTTACSFLCHALKYEHSILLYVYVFLSIHVHNYMKGCMVFICYTITLQLCNNYEQMYNYKLKVTAVIPKYIVHQHASNTVNCRLCTVMNLYPSGFDSLLKEVFIAKMNLQSWQQKCSVRKTCFCKKCTLNQSKSSFKV